MANAMAEPAPPQSGLRPLYFYLVVIIVFIADQVSKAMILKSMAFGEYRQVLGNVFMLTLTRNTGGAWGVLPAQNRIFVVFAAVAIVALLFAYHKVARGDLLVSSAFALALGGAVGNLLDRLRYGFVVDFFDVRVIQFPIFNVADSAITLGIFFLLLHYARSLMAEQNTRKLASGAAGGHSLAPEDLAKSTHD